MVPTITAVRLNGSARRGELPLLVLGPAEGTSALESWAAHARGLVDRFDLLAWDLPGQGYNLGGSTASYTLAELARGVLVVVDDVLAERGETGSGFHHAGVGIGGEVGGQLALDAPTRVIVVDRDDLAPVGVEPDGDGLRRVLVADIDARIRRARADGLTAEEVRECVRLATGLDGDAGRH